MPYYRICHLIEELIKAPTLNEAITNAVADFTHPVAHTLIGKPALRWAMWHHADQVDGDAACDKIEE